MDEPSDFKTEPTRRQCLFGALLAPLALAFGTSTKQVIGADIGAGLAMMGSWSVPREASNVINWLLLHGYEVSEKQPNDGMILMELPPL